VLRFPGRSYSDSLDLSYDGPIPPQLKEAAARLDATEEAKAALRAETPAVTRLTNIRPHDRIALTLMVKTILARACEGRILRQDFEQIGLPAKQIDRLAERARAQALALDPRIGELLGAAA
jgi:hypothetical protein